MTDNEIVKSLECCINEDGDLFACGNQGCVFMECKRGKDRECHYYMMKAVLDLINRQKADIKKLTSGKCVYLSDDETTEYCVEGPCPNYKTVGEIKSEAYKEFAEKLHEELRMYGVKDKFNKAVFLNVVDKAKKEMVGEDKCSQD